MKRRSWKIGIGDNAIDNTVDHMVRLSMRDRSDAKITTLAESLAGKTDRATAKAAYNWIMRNIPYIEDPVDREQLTAPRLLVDGPIDGSDCDDHSMLFASIMASMKIPVWFKVIAWRSRNYTHVYPLVGLREEGIVIPVDTVLGLADGNGFGKEKTPVRRSKVYGLRRSAAKE